MKLLVQVMTNESPYPDGQGHGQANGAEIAEEPEESLCFFVHPAGSKNSRPPRMGGSTAVLFITAVQPSQRNFSLG
jgi:hypothetical protein